MIGNQVRFDSSRISYSERKNGGIQQDRKYKFKNPVCMDIHV